MDILWSASTTMRNPERTLPFLQTIAQLNGEVWNNETQKKLQALLIKNRFYVPTHNNLSELQISILENYSYDMSYEEARDIFDSKNYVDSPMRGRVSFDPSEKLGLVALKTDTDNMSRIKITSFGEMFLLGKIDLNEVVFRSLLKIQFPNPLSHDRRDYNTKPFINVLRLIRRVNLLCEERKTVVKGVSKEEFGIFALSIKSYLSVDKTAEELLDFRYAKEKLQDDLERKAFVNHFIIDYLSNFQRPENNVYEYADNMIRYLRLTKYIYIRGGGYYIDLEPRRRIEIDAILKNDNGSALHFTLEEYKAYISDYNAYILPFETVEELTGIAKMLILELIDLEQNLGFSENSEQAIVLPKTVEKLNLLIQKLREKRSTLQSLQLKYDYQNLDKIDEAICSLKDIRNLGMKPSIALEKWTNIALNIINDAVKIKPNSPLGDDNEPTFTAPAGVSDIECYYDNFSAICEVTMLTGRDQWFNEGQPVMRHLRDFETNNPMKNNYCLFIAPRLHVDTLNTFWTAVKYEYQGNKQKIIPITITQLIQILGIIKKMRIDGIFFESGNLLNLYDNCISIENIADSTLWKSHINSEISRWSNDLLA